MRSKDSILVIEDDHDVRVSYREALELTNLTIHSATNGKDALFLLQKLKKLPKLIILDLSMPIMSGKEFQQELQKSEKFKEIAILTMKRPVDKAEFLKAVDACLKSQKK